MPGLETKQAINVQIKITNHCLGASDVLMCRLFEAKKYATSI